MATNELERAAKSGEPFFMAVGFYKPHLPFCAPLKYWELYDDEDIKLSPNPEAPEGVDKLFLHSSSEFFQYTHPEDGRNGKTLTDDYARDILHAYYAAITYTDTQVGKVIAKLKELGLDKNTIIIVWGDHGWHLGDHSLWGKHSTFDRALNSTFIVKTPDMNQAGSQSNSLVGAIDIYPTICDLAGIEIPESVDGVSIRPIIEDPKAKVRDVVMGYWNNRITIRDQRYRLSLYKNKEEQRIVLFDHKKDPNESINVAEKSPKIVTELMVKLKELNDGFIPRL